MKKLSLFIVFLIPALLIYLSMIYSNFYLVELHGSKKTFDPPRALEKDINVIQHDYPYLDEDQVFVHTSLFSWFFLQFDDQIKHIEKTDLLTVQKNEHVRSRLFGPISD